MVWIAIYNSACPDGIGRMMASDCLYVSMDILTSPTSDGDGFIRFRVTQGGGCDVPHRPQGFLLPDFLSSIFSASSRHSA